MAPTYLLKPVLLFFPEFYNFGYSSIVLWCYIRVCNLFFSCMKAPLRFHTHQILRLTYRVHCRVTLSLGPPSPSSVTFNLISITCHRFFAILFNRGWVGEGTGNLPYLFKHCLPLKCVWPSHRLHA